MSGFTGMPGAKKLPGDRRPAAKRAVALCERVAGGMSLRKAAKAEGLRHTVFLSMVAKDEELRILYTAACDAAIETRILELGEQADAVMRFAKLKGKAASAYVSAFATKARVSQWEAERRMPKKYGNRLDLNHSGSIDLASRLNAARKRTDPPKE